MAECNYCTWKWIKQKYPNAKKVESEYGGWDIYNDKQFLVWFWKLTDNCVC